MTLVVPSLDLHNIFMVLLMLTFALGNIKIGATIPIFLYSGSPSYRGGEGGVCACVGKVCYHCIRIIH